MMHRFVFGVLASTALAAGTASAEDAPSFGRAGTVVLDDVVGGHVLTAAPAPALGAAGIQAGWLSFGSLEIGATKTRYLRLSPSMDVFVSDGASIGVQLGGGVSRYEQPPGGTMKGWDATVVPRVGYAFALADDVAVWPRIAGGVTVFDSPLQTRTGTILHGALELPFVFRLSRRVVFDLGPELAYVHQLAGPFDARGVTGGARGGVSLVF